jgi:16S rRNA (guanine966-N2)-methyltransferase
MVRVESTDAIAWMRRGPPQSFELVFLDPPFDSDLHAAALQAAARLVVLHGYVYLEAARAYSNDELALLQLKVHRHLQAGIVHAHLLQRVDAAPAVGSADAHGAA